MRASARVSSCQVSILEPTELLSRKFVAVHSSGVILRLGPVGFCARSQAPNFLTTIRNEAIMSKAEVPVRDEAGRFKSVSLKILFSGIALIIVGVAIARQIPRQESAPPNELFAHIQNALRTLPIVAGTMLAWVGGVRISLVMRPFNAVLLGLAFVVAALVGPLAAAQVFPQFKHFTWTGEYVLPIFALRITGFILLSTGLVRFLSGGRHAPYK